MWKEKWLPVVLTFSLALNFAFIAVWGYHHFYVRPLLQEKLGKPAEGPEHVFQSLPPALRRDRLKALNLTPEQQQKLSAEIRELTKRIAPLLEKTRLQKERYLSVLATPKSDKQAIEQAERELATEQDGIRRLIFEYLGRFRNMLTEEQLREWTRMMREPHGYPPAPMRGRPAPSRAGPYGPRRDPAPLTPPRPEEEVR
jgi:hypothetical protein